MWAGCALAAQSMLVLGRRGRDPGLELTVRRRTAPLVLAEHAALALSLLAGLALQAERGWGLGHPRWLALKLGLVAFVLVPLEGMHAWVSHGWIRRGLRRTPAPPLSRELERGIGMDDMLRTLAAVLLLPAVVLIVWLSVEKPL